MKYPIILVFMCLSTSAASGASENLFRSTAYGVVKCYEAEGVDFPKTFDETGICVPGLSIWRSQSANKTIAVHFDTVAKEGSWSQHRVYSGEVIFDNAAKDRCNFFMNIEATDEDAAVTVSNFQCIDPKKLSSLETKGRIALKQKIIANIYSVNSLIGEGAAVYPESISCLGVRAEDAGDVSYPEDGVVFGTCLARATLGYPDSEDTIVQITVDGYLDMSIKILASQL